MIEAFSCCPGTGGIPPSCPAAIWLFCSVMDEVTSEVVNWKLFSLFGSSQIRMAYWAPNSCTSPTPDERLIGSLMLEAT
ncbi:hypothetical protein D3C85_1788580 [compost metagenome]